MRTKPLIIGGAVFCLVVLGVVFFPKVHYVDPKPAIAFGEEYFSKLKQSQVDDAFAMYTDGFQQNGGGEWRKLLTHFDTQNGDVRNFKTLGSQVAPVTLRDSTEIPCVLVRYQVTRNALISEERLTICPHQHGEDWGIAGHEITRSDTGEHFGAGLTFREKTIYKTN
ncbi:MAG: hypothetical protein WBZ01_08855 [Terriglobales bacterium]